MNFIADSLFSVLLGWTRSLFNNLWNMLTNDSAGFTGFLQRFWLPIIIILLLGGTLIDYIIWLVRWRPYYIWSARIRERLQRKQLNRTSHYMEDLDHSPLDLPEYQQFQQEQNAALLDEPVYFDFQAVHSPQQEAVPEYFPEFAQQAQPDPFVPELPWSNLQKQPEAPIDLQQDAHNWLQQDDDGHFQPDDDTQYIVTEEPHEQQQLPYPWLEAPKTPLETHSSLEQAETAIRRRRAGSKRREQVNVFKTLKDTFFVTDDNMEPVDSIQAPIAQEDAFHKPFYPQSYSYKEQSSKQPPTPPMEP